MPIESVVRKPDPPANNRMDASGISRDDTRARNLNDIPASNRKNDPPAVIDGLTQIDLRGAKIGELNSQDNPRKDSSSSDPPGNKFGILMSRGTQFRAAVQKGRTNGHTAGLIKSSEHSERTGVKSEGTNSVPASGVDTGHIKQDQEQEQNVNNNLGTQQTDDQGVTLSIGEDTKLTNGSETLDIPVETIQVSFSGDEKIDYSISAKNQQPTQENREEDQSGGTDNNSVASGGGNVVDDARESSMDNDIFGHSRTPVNISGSSGEDDNVLNPSNPSIEQVNNSAHAAQYPEVVAASSTLNTPQEQQSTEEDRPGDQGGDSNNISANSGGENGVVNASASSGDAGKIGDSGLSEYIPVSDGNVADALDPNHPSTAQVQNTAPADQNQPVVAAQSASNNWLKNKWMTLNPLTKSTIVVGGAIGGAAIGLAIFSAYPILGVLATGAALYLAYRHFASKAGNS